MSRGRSLAPQPVPRPGVVARSRPRTLVRNQCKATARSGWTASSASTISPAEEAVSTCADEVVLWRNRRRGCLARTPRSPAMSSMLRGLCRKRRHPLGRAPMRRPVLGLLPPRGAFPSTVTRPSGAAARSLAESGSPPSSEAVEQGVGVVGCVTRRQVRAELGGDLRVGSRPCRMPMGIRW